MTGGRRPVPRIGMFHFNFCVIPSYLHIDTAAMLHQISRCKYANLKVETSGLQASKTRTLTNWRHM